MTTRLHLLLVAAALFTSPAVAVDDPQWQLPPGFTIELVAGPDLVQHPTMGGFDEKGRLYICDGPGENMPAKDLLEKLPNCIRRLEDTDGDGKFDKSTMFADKMTFPMGALWHDGYVYTASPPHIWRLRDADDDGIAEERKILVSEFGFTGNAADIHGCFLGPEGRIWWCDGRHGHNFVDENGNMISKGLAARLFSCKPDGSDVQSFAGGGMDNPVEVCFTEEGEPLGTVAIYDNLPDRVDAIIHWVYGGAYPYYPKVLEEFKKTGPLLPAVSRFGRVAPSGIARYRSHAWGEEFVGNLFHAQFNTHRILRTMLTRDGATFKSTDEDFLVSPNQDVHLTDVIEDADGSLLVVDTGGWFRLGCPNSQIAKPDIIGGIYRIRKTDAAKAEDPRGRREPWHDVPTTVLASRLRDSRPSIRDRAMAELVERAKLHEAEVIGDLQKIIDYDDDDDVLPHVWTLARIATPQARATLREAMEVEDARVRQSVACALGSLRDKDSIAQILQLLGDSDAAVRREAATALGRLKTRSAVSSLLAAFHYAKSDRFLEHALIYALVEINDGSTTAAGLSGADPNVRRGALIALDQMGDGRLTRDAVAALLEAGDTRLQQAALEVMQRHADWGDAVLGFLKQRLAQQVLFDAEENMLAVTILAYKANPQVQELVAATLTADLASPQMRRLLLGVIERSEFSAATLPPSWAEQIRKHLAYRDDATKRAAIDAAARVGAEPFDQALVALAGDSSQSEELRVAALSIVGSRLPRLDDDTFNLLMARLTSAPDSLDRLGAAAVLGVAPLNAAQRADLIKAVAKAGPMELPPLLGAFDKESSPEEGSRLLAALASSPGLDNVTSSALEKIVSQYPAEVRSSAEPLFKRINADIETQRARLTELLPKLEGGDKAHGAIVFQMQKTGCSSCHRVGTRGVAIGPDLTKVGQIRGRADILESVLYPSASFVRNYESVQVQTTDGLTVTGLLARETPEAVYIRTAQKEEKRVPRNEIETIAPSKLSIMPQGMDKVMNFEELRDLVAYLQSLK